MDAFHSNIGLFSANPTHPQGSPSYHDELGVATFDGDRLAFAPYWDFPPTSPAGFILQTHSGRMLPLAQGQMLVTVDEDGRLAPAEPTHNLLAVRLAAPLPDSMLDLIHEHWLPEEAAKTRIRYEPSVYYDADFGYFLGLMVGDGWVNAPGAGSQSAVMLANTDPEVTAELYRIMRRYIVDGPLTFTTIESPHDFDGHAYYSRKISFSSSRFARLLRSEIGCGAENKRLPSFWAWTPSEFRWGLLAGLIDTDGTVAVCAPRAKARNVRSTQTMVQYYTRSPGLAEDVVLLACSLGLHATISATVTPQGKPTYQVVFTQESIDAMKGRLPLQVQKKADALASHTLGTARRRGAYAPPAPRARLKELRRALHTERMAREENWSPDYEKRRKRFYGNVSDTLRKPDPKNGRRGCGALLQDTAEAIIREIPRFFDEGYWRRWKEIVEDPRFAFEIITGIHDIESLAEGTRRRYDTLPTITGENTVSAGGLLVTSDYEPYSAKWRSLSKAA